MCIRDRAQDSCGSARCHFVAPTYSPKPLLSSIFISVVYGLPHGERLTAVNHYCSCEVFIILSLELCLRILEHNSFMFMKYAMFPFASIDLVSLLFKLFSFSIVGEIYLLVQNYSHQHPMGLFNYVLFL